MAFPLFIVSFNVFVFVLAVIYGHGQGDVFHYFQEGRLITFWSSFQLVAIAVFCWVIHERDRLRHSGPVWSSGSLIWALMALGFLFLAFDETLMIHENADFKIHEILDIPETNLTDRLDDFIVLFYGLAGFYFMWRFRSGLTPYLAVARKLVVPGILIFLAMVAADVLTNRRDIILDENLHNMLSLLEEATKIAAECLLLLGAYQSWKLSCSRSIT